MYFESGIDDYCSWLTVMKDHKLLKQAGAWYTIQHCDTDTGELIKEHKFQSKDFEELLNKNPELKKYCYDQIFKEQVLKYSNKLGIDDVEFAEGEVLGDD